MTHPRRCPWWVYFYFIFTAQAWAQGTGASLEPKRIAVLVGSGRPAMGRPGLRFAHRDVENMAEVLEQAGRFSAGDVRLLMDATPQRVLDVLDAAAATLARASGETLLLFYYSGHADEHSLYPNGNPLPISELRKRLDQSGATARVGIIDACRGGGWTHAKGLSAQPPFEVAVPMTLSSEGSVLMASSSGIENAHEADQLEGSFFTHHLVAGLRGAADYSGDGIVSAAEAFQYAKERTVRDTSLRTDSPQNPSFSMNLRGRSDLPITAIASSATTVTLQQRQGPLQLIHVTTGIKLLELPEGERLMTLAVGPGRYLVRRKSGGHVYAKVIEVQSRQAVTVAESALPEIEESSQGIKGPLPRHRAFATTLAEGDWEFLLGVQVDHSFASNPVGQATNVSLPTSLAWGITDRLQWKLLAPNLSYRFGEVGEREWVVTGGVAGLDLVTVPAGFSVAYTLLASMDFRQWVVRDRGVLTVSAMAASTGLLGQAREPADDWRGQIAAGYSHHLGRVTLNLGISYLSKLIENGSVVGPVPVGGVLALGGLPLVALRPRPLLQLHIGPVFSLYVNASVAVALVSQHVSLSSETGLFWIL